MSLPGRFRLLVLWSVALANRQGSWLPVGLRCLPLRACALVVRILVVGGRS